MPISLMIWAGLGSDSAVIKVASAYEAATHHRVPTPAFGPLPIRAIKAELPAQLDKSVSAGEGGAK
jgi:hypothetical protein